jgi:hypothetical protein
VRPRSDDRAAPALAAALSIEALTVAMALAPGIYTRNRMFAFFAAPAVRRARVRAGVLRGIVRQLPRASRVDLAGEPPLASGEPRYVLRYQLPEVHLSRIAELTRVELAALRLLAARAAASALPPSEEDHAIVNATLSGLMHADAASRDLARAARDSAAPPPAME